jgi:holliday junction DNA helicase RuvB
LHAIIEKYILRRQKRIDSQLSNSMGDIDTSGIEEIRTFPNIDPLELLLFEDFIGQEKVIDVLRIAVQSALLKQRSLDHVLFYGPAGVGKSLLAIILRNEMNALYKTFLGSELKNVSSLTEMFTFLSVPSFNKILFIDEMHHIPTKTAENLYEAVQDFRIKTIKIPPFTLIGATTEPGDIPRPLLDRFSYQLKLDPYSKDDLALMLLKKYPTLDEEVADYIANRSKGNPRITYTYLKQIDNAAIVDGSEIKARHAEFFMEIMQINSDGLTVDDIKLLKLLADTPLPLGKVTLCSILGFSESDYNFMIEPYLLRLGFMTILPRGRKITSSGFNYLIEKGILR